MRWWLCGMMMFAASALRADELVDRSISVGGQQRTYHVHKDRLPSKPLPLVVVLHGGGGNGKFLEDTYQIVQDKGRANAEKFFKGVSGLTRLSQVKPGDRVIKSIVPLDGSQAACVEIEVTLNGKKQPPGTEIWGRVDGKWCYRETTK